jgi:hypothetical protein
MKMTKEIDMAKSMSIREIEHTIEALPQADQVRLLEKMIKNLKHSLLGGKSSVPKVIAARSSHLLRGALKQYANPTLRANEEDAFSKALKDKHAHS